MPTKENEIAMSANAVKEKSKKAPKRGPDGYASDLSELGESIDALSEVEVKMRLEAMDTFGKWYVAKVLEIDEDSGEVLVHFDRWSSRYDEYIPIGSSRLRKLTANRLKELQKEREPVYMIGDRVQAKWEDGKMYFGKVLQVHEDTVDVLFDDGVEYTAPFRAVRRRRPDKPVEHSYDSSAESSEAAEARRSRARKRSRNDDSASQSTMSSPPSSPLTSLPRKRPCRRIDSDSTETESDFDDPGHPHIGECPLKPTSTGTSSSEGEYTLKPVATSTEGKCTPNLMDPSSERGEYSLTPVVSGSESEQPLPLKRGRGRPRKLREPYKLRKPAKLEPVQEDEVKMSSEGVEGDDGGEGGRVISGALPTPPSGDCTPHLNPIPKPATLQVSPNKESPKQIPNPTPPETPQINSHSEGGILKRMLSQDESPTTADQTKKTPPSQEGATSPSSKKKSPVSSRTRAQTKFENVTKKVDKKDKKQTKTAPKELVIVWDHNEFKCKFTGCNKSFRKESLLQSHVKHYHTKETRAPRTPNKTKGPSGAAKKSQSPRSPQSQNSPFSPSRLSLSPCSPITPASHDSETIKSPRTRKPKSILSPPPRRNPSRSKSSADMVENREKSPTESFFEFMEKEKKSGEVMQLLELATKEHQKTAAAFHVHVHPTHRGPVKTAEKGGATPGPSKGAHSKAVATVSATSKKLAKQSVLNVSGTAVVSVAGPPLKGSSVEIRALSHDSLPHPSPIVRTASESSSTMATVHGLSKIGHEAQLNNSDSVEEMDTSNEGESHSFSPTNEASEEDVVHCLCGSIEDEGFMIQCEQCLCWQHGDCVGLTEETLPKKYICYICDNPPGLRKRYQYQFDQDWFSEGALPSLPGGPKFANSESMKRTHELAGQLYKLRKMMHSSKVKLQAASTVNHPYLKQWAKECVHRSKDDIMGYIMRSLLPVSYPPQQFTNDQESSMTSSESRQQENNLSDTERADDLASSFKSDIVGAAAFSSQNGTDRAGKDGEGDSISPPIDVSSLQLDPLPRSPPSPQLPPTPPEDPPDPKSLQLVPLPPLTAEDQPPLEQTRTSPSEKEDKQDEGDADSNVKTPHHPNTGAGMSLEVFNDEFGVQEMSVFATSVNQYQVSATLEHTNNVMQGEQPNPHIGSNPGRLVSSGRSAFRPVIVTLCDTSSSAASSETTPQSITTSAKDNGKSDDSATAATTNPAEQKPIKAEYDSVVKKTLSCLPATAKSKSGMDSVTLGEFSEAFMKGDTTNWFQRMLLLDHIEAVQDKIRSWMEMIDKQLDDMPDDDSRLEDMETLMKNVQSSVEQLSKLQQSATVS